LDEVGSVGPKIYHLNPIRIHSLPINTWKLKRATRKESCLAAYLLSHNSRDINLKRNLLPFPHMESSVLYDVEEFWKFDLRVGMVKDAEKIPNSKKLIKLEVDFGGEERTIVTGIGDQYSPDDLKEKRMIFVLNLKPKKLMGVESRGMLLLAEEDSGKVHLITAENVPVGTKVW